MDFEKFKSWALEDVSSRLPEEYDGAELYFEEIKKFGGNYTGLSLRKPGSTVSPAVNMEQFYGYYLNGADTNELGRVMAEMLQYRFNNSVPDLDWICDYETASEHFFLCLSNAGCNPDFFENAPHWKRSDLVLTCHVMSEIPGEGYIGTVVNYSLFEDYDVDEDRLFEDAVKNSIRMMPPKLEFARDLYDDEVEREEDDPFYDLMVVSNEKHFRGAAVLFYPGVMEEIAMKLGGDYYIIPSSVHEVLAIPADPSLSVDYLNQLVTEANLLHVPENERLSDGVYLYEESSGTFKKAEAGSNVLN
jgi:hypothetical protein